MAAATHPTQARLTDTGFGALPRDTIAYLSSYTAFLILGFITLLLLLTTILFFLGVEITPYHAPAAFILTVLTPFFYRPRPQIHNTTSAAALASFFSLLCIVSILIT